MPCASSTSELPPWTERHGGHCPSCKNPYHNRWKSRNCLKCGYFLGGTHVPNPNKKPKLRNPVCVQIVGTQIFSTRTGSCGSRCFAFADGNTNICYHDKCLKARNVTVGSSASSVADFCCKNIGQISNNSSAENEWRLSDRVMDNYPCDAATKESIGNIAKSLSGMPAVIKVASKAFTVFGPPSTSAPLGWVHVSRLRLRLRLRFSFFSAVNSLEQAQRVLSSTTGM